MDTCDTTSLLDFSFKCLEDGVGSSDVVQMAYQVAGAYIDNADLSKEGWVVMTRVQNFPNIATQSILEKDYDKAAFLVDLYSAFCRCGRCYILNLNNDQGHYFREGLLYCLTLPATEDAVTSQDEPISGPAVLAWEAFADGAEAVEEYERDTADPDHGLSEVTIQEWLTRIMQELIQQSRPSYTATDGVHRALIWDWAVECLMSIYDWIGADAYVSNLIQLAPAPVGQRITASSEFDWQAQDAILAAISAVADPLGEFVMESEATSQNVMQLVLGVWQFPPGIFPAKVEDALYDHVVAALLPLGFSFMSNMTQERAEEFFRFVLKKVKDHSFWSWVSASLVLYIVEAALSCGAHIDDEMLAVLYQLAIECGFKKDSQRPKYTAACMLGILGNKSVMAQGLEASRQGCYRLLAGADVCLWSSLQARPTHEAIGAGECAIECLSLAIETACGFHAEQHGGKMLSSIMAQCMSELWPRIMQAMAGDIPVPVRRDIVKLMDTAMTHLRDLFLPMLDSFLEMCCTEVIVRRDFCAVSPVCDAFQVFQDTPSVMPLLLKVLSSLSRGLPDGDQLVEVAKVDPDIIKAIVTYTNQVIRSLSDNTDIILDGFKRVAALSANQNLEVSPGAMQCLIDMIGLIAKSSINPQIQQGLISQLHSCGERIIVRLLMSLWEHGAVVRVDRLVYIIAGLTNIPDVKMVLIKTWLPKAFSEIQRLRPSEDLQIVQTEWILHLQQVPGGMTPDGDILQEGWYPFKELVRILVKA
eukprot:jgi/Botrbrau1/14000/Bobra.150_1s0010.2